MGTTIIHAADPHLDFRGKQVQQSNELGRNIREYDFYLAFERLVHAVLAMAAAGEPPRALVIAGDLFHAYRVSNAVLKATIALLNLLEAAGIEVIIIAGNHDTPQNRTITCSFESLMEIEYEHIHFAYDSIERVTVGDTEFVMLPHLALNSGFDPESLRPDLAGHRHSVLVAHGVAAGNEIFRQLDEQREAPIGENLLELGHTYVCLGHHHRLSRVQACVYYSGSLENTAFGKDAQEHRGALVVDLDAAAADPEGFRPPLMEIPVRKLIEPPVLDVTGLDARGVEEAVRDALAPFDLTDALVRLAVTGITKDVSADVDRKSLTALGSAALYFRLDWRMQQVESAGTGTGSEHIRPLDEEYAAAVEAHYAANAGTGNLPAMLDVTERGTEYIRRFLEEVEEDD